MKIVFRRLAGLTVNLIGWFSRPTPIERSAQERKFLEGEVKRLRDKLEAGILAAVPYAFVTGDPGNRLPNTANIAFEYIEVFYNRKRLHLTRLRLFDPGFRDFGAKSTPRSRVSL